MISALEITPKPMTSSIPVVGAERDHFASHQLFVYSQLLCKSDHLAPATSLDLVVVLVVIAIIISEHRHT